MSEASGSGAYQKLPPGWDCKYDQATGNCYYINYFTKAMQLEDPRSRYKQLQNERCSTESIPLQHVVTQQTSSGAGLSGVGNNSHNNNNHNNNNTNTSLYHVYPSNSLTAVRAFQERRQLAHSLQNASSSPLLSSRAQLDMSSPLPFGRTQHTQTPRLGHQHLSRRSTIQETSFTNQFDTDGVVAKIQNMFPTAGENHIRLLLKRYMKNIFPKADETLLLDILANADNNVQIASENLLSLGYNKRDFVPAKPNNRPPDLGAREGRKPDDERIIPLRPKEYTQDEKVTMQSLLKEKYPQIAERIILMALESVSYAEDRAIQILQIVQEEDVQRAQQGAHANGKAQATDVTLAEFGAIDATDSAVAQVGSFSQLNRSSQRNSNAEQMAMPATQDAEYQSLLGRMARLGHNAQLAKGPDENLLLADYITWNGANPSNSAGQKQLASGPDASLLSERSYKALGRNPELCKGSKTTLAKGSIYAQNKSTNIKCN